MLLYLTKHDGWGGRWRPLSPAINPENLSRGRPRKRQAYVFFKKILAEFLKKWIK